MTAGRHALRGVERWGVLILALVLWQLVTSATGSIYFPEPTTIVDRIGDLWFSAGLDRGVLTGTFVDQVVSTLARLFVGWSAAVVVGVTVGLALGLSRRVEDYVDPTLQFLRSLPVPALIPIFLILLGTGFSMRVALVVFAVIWPIVLNTVEGVRSVAPQKVQTGVAFKIPRHAQITRIILPAAAPSIFAGLRISLSIALIITVLSEMVASAEGVGQGLVEAQRTFAMPDLWAYIVLLAFLGVAINAALQVLENRVLGWHIGARRRDNGS